MALQAIVDNLDNVPEALKAEYVEITDAKHPLKGKFALDIDDAVKDHPKVRNLSTALERQKADRLTAVRERDEARAKIEGLPEDFTPEKFLELAAHAPDPNDPTKPAKVDEQIQSQKRMYEQRIQAQKDKHEAELRKLQTEKAELDGENTALVVDDSLRKALIDAGVDKPFIKAALAMLRPSAKAVRDEETKARRGVVLTDLGEEDIPSFVNKWVQSDEGKVFVKPPAGGGAGGTSNQPGGTPNPWKKDTENLTEQHKLVMRDPARAAQMAKAAGVAPNWVSN